MPAFDWPTEALKRLPAWSQGHLHIDPHTRRPLHVGDQPVGCSEHGIAACGVCTGTVEPWEPRPHAEGTIPKRPEPGQGVIERNAVKRPAVTFRPVGHGTGTVRIKHPDLNQPLTVARLQRTDGPARLDRDRANRPITVADYGPTVTPAPAPAPEPEPEPDPTGDLTPELARLLAWADSLEA